jgi:quercetin dioxygenase-like cupin family protein
VTTHAAPVRLRLDGAAGTDVLNLGDPSSVAVARLVVEPGAMFPWHTHPGPVLVSVVSGDLVHVNADDCVERPYPAGTAFVDPGRGNVHTAFNDGDEDTGPTD